MIWTKQKSNQTFCCIFLYPAMQRKPTLLLQVWMKTCKIGLIWRHENPLYETIHFLNLSDNSINLSTFSLTLGQLENLTTVQKVNDLLFFWPLSRERNVVRISWSWLFYCLWPKEEFDMHFKLIKSFWLFLLIIKRVGEHWPLQHAPCSWLKNVSTLGMFPMGHRTHPHRPRLKLAISVCLQT